MEKILRILQLMSISLTPYFWSSGPIAEFGVLDFVCHGVLVMVIFMALELIIWVWNKQLVMFKKKKL